MSAPSSSSDSSLPPPPPSSSSSSSSSSPATSTPSISGPHTIDSTKDSTIGSSPTPIQSSSSSPSSSTSSNSFSSSTSSSAPSSETSEPEWTKDKLIAHLLRPGYKYLNLNPYAVLRVSYEATDDDIKKAYRGMSRFVHPDKNIEDQARSQEAFEAVNKAYKMLTDEEGLEKCRTVVEEAKRRVETAQPDLRQSNKDKYDGHLMLEMSKIFAEVEKRRVHLEERDATERKRKREQELETEDKRKKEKDFEEQWEKNRDTRVNSWRDFATGKGKAKKKETKPPKVKLTK